MEESSQLQRFSPRNERSELSLGLPSPGVLLRKDELLEWMGLKAKGVYLGRLGGLWETETLLFKGHTQNLTAPGPRAEAVAWRGSWIRPTCWSHRGSERRQRREDSLGTQTLTSHLWELFLPQGRWCWHCQGEVLPPGPCFTGVSLKTKNRATIWPSNSTLGYISRKDRNTSLKRYMHPNVHRSIIYNSQGMEQPKCPSTDEWEEDAVYKCRGKTLRYNKEKKKNILPFATTCGWTWRVLSLVKSVR